MGVLDYLLLAAVVCGVCLALRSCRKTRKNGCGGNCAACAHSCKK